MQVPVKVQHRQSCSEQWERPSAHLHFPDNLFALAPLYSLVELIEQRSRLLGLCHGGRRAL